MEENVFQETIEFSEELYQKNIAENTFTEIEDGVGDDNANN